MNFRHLIVAAATAGAALAAPLAGAQNLDPNAQYQQDLLRCEQEQSVVDIQACKKEAAAAHERIARLSPPTELNNTNYDLAAAVQQKAEIYANTQYQAISKTKTAADPAQQLTDNQEEQSRMLEETMIRESPTGLFTASEITALRDNLTLPAEQ